MSPFLTERFLVLVGLGFGTGAYGTLIGAGGGFVLVPLLILLYPLARPELLTSISLAAVFFNALSGTGAYARMKRVDYRSGLLFAVATIPGAILGALNTSAIPRTLFDGIFGCCLLAGAIFLLLKGNLEKRSDLAGPPPRHAVQRTIREAGGASWSYSFNPVLGLVISLFVGYISSFLGIGGGIIHVPALVYLLNFPVHIATATSHFILAIMAFTGTVVHVINGSFTHGVFATTSLAVGMVLGAQLGARLSNRLKGSWIVRSLAIALGLVSIRILVSIFELKG